MVLVLGSGFRKIRSMNVSQKEWSSSWFWILVQRFRINMSEREN